ncbi:hypothetical protein JCM10450v2_004941 [Rhodotorula kratochvilovae]
MPPKKGPVEVAQGKRSILAYFSSSPAVLGRAADAGAAPPSSSSPSHASAPCAAVAASSSSTRAQPGAAAAGPSAPRKTPLRGTHSLSTLEPGPASSSARGQMSRSTSAAPGAGLAPPAAAMQTGAAGPSAVRRSPRVASRPPSETGELRAMVKDESVSPSKAGAYGGAAGAGAAAGRYPLRQRSAASATPGPADKGKGKAKAPSNSHEIPDSSSEGEQARSHAQHVLARSSPQKQKRTPQRLLKKENYKWTTGASGRDELDLTLSSSPSVASTLGDDDSDDSEIVVVSFKARNADMRGSRSASGSLTPRAATATASKPRPSPLVKKESHSSVGPPSPSAACRQSPRLHLGAPASAKGKEKALVEQDDAALMPPPSSPMRKAGALPGPATPSRTAAHSPARPLRSGSKSQVLSPVVEVPLVKRARTVSAASAASATTPRVAVTSASPAQRAKTLGDAPAASSDAQSTPPRASAVGSSRPTFEQSSSLTSISSLSSLGAPVTSSAFAAAPAAAGLSTPRRTASHPALPSSSPAAGPAGDNANKLTSSALRAVPPRTPHGGPSYIRDPSGSPLSSLAPTPRPLSRAATWGSSSVAAGAGAKTGRRTWREHTFELVIPEPPPSKRRRALGSASSRTVTPAGGSSSAAGAGRRPAFGAVKREGEVRRERDGPTSEWDAFMRDEGESSADDDGDEEDGAGSPSPAKKARAAPAEEDDDGDASSSSSSDSDAGSDSDADDLAAMLAAAKAKREAAGAGAAAPSMSGGTSPTTAKTTVSPPLDAAKIAAAAAEADADEPRRSSRARHAPEHFSPSKPGSSVTKPAGAAGTAGKKRAAPSLGLVAPGGGRGSGLTFEKIMREREDKEQRGRGQEWFDGWMKKLGAESADEGGDGEDSDARSNLSDDDLAPPNALSRLNALDASRVASALADNSDDDLPAPAVATKKAREVERVLAEEREAERRRAADGETREEREKRGMWRERETAVGTPKKECEAWVGEGWRGAVAKALKDALTNPARFLSTFSLFSPISPAGLGTPEDHRVVSQWLLSINRLTTLLHRIALHTARSAATASSALLTAEDLVGALVRVGAKESLMGEVDPAEKGEKADAMDVDEPVEAEEEGKVMVSEHERREVVGRWCRVVQAFSGTSPRLLNDDDAVSLAVLCVRLSLDPTSATSRSTLGWTLRALLAPLPDPSPARIYLFHQLLALYGSSRPRLQLAVLQALPHDTEPNKGLRRWLAWAFLANEKSAAVPSGGLTSSILSRLLALLSSPPAGSPFRSPSASDAAADDNPAARDTALAECTRILFIALTSLDLPLLASPSRTDERKTLDVLLSYIQSLDSRLRADARKGLMVERLVAKNLLTALHHTGMYQLRAARGQSGGFGFSEEEDRALERSFDGGRVAKKAKVEGGADGMKQTALAFRKPAAAAREVERKASTSDEEVEDELMRL